MRFALVLILALSACADWPDAGGKPLSRASEPWPELVPLSELFGTLPEAEATEADRLAARAAGLRARASVLRRNVSNRDDIEALRARLAR